MAYMHLQIVLGSLREPAVFWRTCSFLSFFPVLVEKVCWTPEILMLTAHSCVALRCKLHVVRVDLFSLSGFGSKHLKVWTQGRRHEERDMSIARAHTMQDNYPLGNSPHKHRQATQNKSTVWWRLEKSLLSLGLSLGFLDLGHGGNGLGTHDTTAPVLADLMQQTNRIQPIKHNQNKIRALAKMKNTVRLTEKQN